MKLWCENIPGGLPIACTTINREDFWIEWKSIAAMDFNGYYTTVVFVVTDTECQRLAEGRKIKQNKLDPPTTL